MAEAEMVVVGGGPCGSTAAAVLGERGHEVLILDQDEFPREKPCGDGILHPAVLMAQEMGIGNLIEQSQEIEAARTVLGHRRQKVTHLNRIPGRPRPRCITRKLFDAGLLAAAQDRGAQFLRGRVDGLADADGGSPRLTAVVDGERVEVRAGTIIAADGATSRLRRVIGVGSSRPVAYAVRQYFRTERPLEPIFDFYLPLEVGGAVVSGYGWMFPLDEHTANIGVGCYRQIGGSQPALTKLLEVFLEELQVKARHRYGQLEQIGRPHGSPLGIRAELSHDSVPGVIFSGDAAGTTHALSGEGISFAMHAGRAAAEIAHARSRPPTDRGASTPPKMSRLFPQLGVDVAVLNRIWVREMTNGFDSSGGSTPPFLHRAKRLMGESAYDTSLRDTAIWQALAAQDARLGNALDRTNDAILDALADRFPLITEVTFDAVRSPLGPLSAATVIVAAGGEREETATLDAAVAAGSVWALPRLLAMLAPRSSSKATRVNNAFAILAADFLSTRALDAATKVGSRAVEALALTCRTSCQGGMRDAAARFAADRSQEDWLLAAAETDGAATAFGAELGAIVNGDGEDLKEALHRFGVELGIACRIGEELIELAPSPTGRFAGLADLRRGIYPLAVLYAVEAEPRLPSLLAQFGRAEGDDPLEILATIRDCGGVERAEAECRRRLDEARSIAESCPGARGESLVTLADAPAACLALLSETSTGS